MNVQEALRKWNEATDVDSLTRWEIVVVIDALTARVAELEAALMQIEKGEGPYSRDPLTHAGNTIDAMVQIAVAALATSEQVRKG